jgi:hypothetical protein
MKDQIDCEKAFIVDEDTLLCLDRQTLFARKLGKNLDPIPFKYSDPERVQYIGQTHELFYFVAGIRFYRWGAEGLSNSGVALRNEKAVLMEANPFTRTLLYRIG